MINTSGAAGRTLVVLLSVGVAGVASMGTLKIFHDWAFRTEFRFWLLMTTIHSCIVFVLFALSFGAIRPNLLSASGIAKCVGAMIVGGLVALLIMPYGVILIISGQAFITSGVAVLIYSAVSAEQKRV
jgi:hypothetical protein